MIKLRELVVLILALIVLSFSYAFTDLDLFLSALIVFSIVLAVNVLGKKAAAYYLGADVEFDTWKIQRYGFREKSQFKNPIPIGIILPAFLSFFTLGYAKWFAVIETDVKETAARAAKRYSYYSFYDVTELHLAWILACGVIANFLLAVFAYIINYPLLTKLSIYYVFFNLLPVGKLDGTKILFGSRILWFVLGFFSLLSVFYAVVL